MGATSVSLGRNIQPSHRFDSLLLWDLPEELQENETQMIQFHRKLLTVFLILVIPVLTYCDNKPIEDKALSSNKGFSDVATVTLEVGKRAPEFSLTSLDGKTVSLESLSGQKAIMVFYRGHWCPFCLSHLEDIQKAFPELLEMGYTILAISPDGAEGMQKMADKIKLYTYQVILNSTLYRIRYML